MMASLSVLSCGFLCHIFVFHLMKIITVVDFTQVHGVEAQPRREHAQTTPDSRPGCEFNGVFYDVGSRVEDYEACLDQCECRVPALGGEPEITCSVAKVCQNRAEECPSGASTLWTICKCPYCYKDPFIIHTYTTPPTYYYQYHPVALATKRILVHVEATNDAHLAFSAEPRDLASMYEIVLGGWLNKYSVIRRCKQCEVLAWATTIGILPNKRGQSFWVRFDGGVVAVGLSGFPSFLQYHDPNPLPVRYVGFATRLGSTGKFRFLDIDAIEHITDNLEPSGDFAGCSSVMTVNQQTSPILIPEPIVSRIFLYISSDTDVVLSLSNDNYPNGSETYRIIVGYGTGVRSSIDKCNGDHCETVSSAETFNLIDKDRLYGFWLNGDPSTGGAITFGREGHPAFLSFGYPATTSFQGDFYNFIIALSIKNAGSADFRLCR